MNRTNLWLTVFVAVIGLILFMVMMGAETGVDSANIANGTIQEEDLLAINVATDGYAATYDAASGGFEWVAGGGGGGVHPVDVSSDVTGVLPAANGGTDQAVPTEDNILIGNGSTWVKEHIPDCGANTWFRLQYVTSTNDINCENALIDSVDIANNSITSIDILDGTIAATDVVTGGITTVEILDATILEVDLNVDDTPVDGERLTYKAGGNFRWEPAGGGGGVVALGRPAITAGTVYFSVPGVAWNTQGTGANTSEAIFFYPFYTATEIDVDRIGVEVTTASVSGGATARLGIYESSTDWQPTNLVVDAGTVAVDSTGVKTLAITETLPAGRYLMAWISDVADAQYREMKGFFPNMGINPAMGFAPFVVELRDLTAAGEHTALSDPGNEWDATAAGNGPFIYIPFLRVSSP